jgi:CheY-like chemotaxis protein
MNIEDATALVVDDEIELQEIFSSWLRRSGCTVYTAGNGAEALKILASHKIDVLVSDVHMPIMSGIELVRAVHRMRLAIPGIIFVSGFGDVDLPEMHALGVEKLIEKPLRLQDLKAAIQASLHSRTPATLPPELQSPDTPAPAPSPASRPPP